MKQHAVPQEIMSVEFNLFGSMNIRQFGYIAAAGGLGYMSYLILPGFLKWIGAGVFILGGLALAFAPGFDAAVMSFLLTLKKPTRRVWKKNPEPPPFLLDIPGALKAYSGAHVPTSDKKKKGMEGSGVYSQLTREEKEDKELEVLDMEYEVMKKDAAQLRKMKDAGSGVTSTGQQSLLNQPNTISGQVLDLMGNPVSGAIVVVRDALENSILAVKANSKGLFLSNKPLPLGKFTVNYELEGKTLGASDVVANGEIIPFINLKATLQ